VATAAIGNNVETFSRDTWGHVGTGGKHDVSLLNRLYELAYLTIGTHWDRLRPLPLFTRAPKEGNRNTCPYVSLLSLVRAMSSALPRSCAEPSASLQDVRRRGYGLTPAEITRCDDAISLPGARAAWVVQA
jgi:hypothetical protein